MAQGMPTHDPVSIPVAIFVGGTSGIGQGLAQAFAKHTKGNAHIIIVGRNKSKAQSIISSFPTPPSSSQAKHEFIECDVSSLSNIRSIIPRLPEKVNYLVMTPGYHSLKGYDATPEGIDRKLGVVYYGRWELTRLLVPHLQRAQSPAKVFSVLAAGGGSAIDLDDLGLKKHYSPMGSVTAAATYNDLMVQEYAARYPEISFSHVFPGFVRSSLLANSFPLVGPILSMLMWPFANSVETVGETLLKALLDVGHGPHRIGARGDDLGWEKAYYGSEEARKKLWEHTVQVSESVKGSH